MPDQKNSSFFLLLSLLAVLLFVLDLAYGPVSIPVEDVFRSISGGKASKETWDYIIVNYRLPKAITAVLTGIGLAVSGLLMQTLFRNPLAGPDVLGLSSGSSLGVAFVVMGAGLIPGILSVWMLSSYGIILASCFGSFLVLLAILAVSRRLRDTMAILIVGLMFASFASAIVSILTYFSTAEQLQKFTFWAMGNLGNLSWLSITILAVCISTGLAIAVLCIKPLDALLLGENYAKSLGLHYKRAQFTIIIATSLLTGSITAFAGPVAFVGLVVPHMAKLLFRTSDHKVLFFATVLFGAIIVLLCDILCQFPGSDVTLPINAITSLIGAPVVIWLLMRKRKTFD
ncbi:iron ABC transporter permease [Flavobacterium selenitireducens]|uniref:iron ABC transporter permease n=1 Tax=Flavobacterium selenitireducens TaxID=2722704 RepID=UPI00168BB01D|nr:iron ABC transporter permease [Flavobacterium selenitireducens]MBD3582824.1 iron ABC transporter permease [Flavobacterium selenitireducens]